MIAPRPPVDECQTNPCFNGGTCSPTPAGYTCYCEEGYKGDTCEGEGCRGMNTPVAIVSNEEDGAH